MSHVIAEPAFPPVPESSNPYGVSTPCRRAKSSTADLPLGGVSVLLVDDEPMLTEVVSTYLEQLGCRQVAAIHDPRLAMQAIRERRPHVVLLDLTMPELSGFEILEALRADSQLRGTLVIVLSASNDNASRLRALELGATAYLAKPIGQIELAAVLRCTVLTMPGRSV